MIRSATPLVALLFALLSAQTHAQHDTNWYQVELMVFNYLKPNTNEQWPLFEELGYPAAMQALEPVSKDTRADRAMRFVTLEDAAAAAAPIDLLWEQPLASLWQQVAEQEAAGSAPASGSPIPEGTATANPATPEAVPVLTVPVSFSRLPADEQLFAGEVDRIRRSPDLHLLYHESWLQPMRGRERSVPLVLDSEERRGAYPVLQGSILLYVSRYLHIETDLWVNIDSGDASAGRYLQPPPQPVGAASAAAWEFRIATEKLNLEAADPAAAFEAIAVADPDAGQAPASEPTLEQLAALAGPPSGPWYDFTQPVKIKQRRRMRSSEVHFLDHPLVGIVVTITPYEFSPFVDNEELPVSQ